MAIISLSILLQFTAAGLAVRLIWTTGRKLAWSLIAVAMVLMGVRRCVSLYRLVSSDGVVTTDFSAELIALTISFLMFTGVAWLGPLFAEIRKTNKALKESEERFRVFIDNVPALVSLKDMDGRYIFINEAYRKNFGMSQAECEGKGAASLFSGAIAEGFAAQERQVIETMAPVTREHEVPHSDGKHIHLCTKFPVLDTQGKVASVGTISTDITDRIQAEDDRNTALINAEEAN